MTCRQRAAIVACIGLTVPIVALAHGGPVDIAFYGGFTVGAGRCLRTVSTAADRCVLRVLSLHRDCVDAQLRGQTCDPAAIAGQIDAVKVATGGVVFAACTGGQLTELQLVGVSDAQADLLKACDQAEAMSQILYAPLPSPLMGVDAARAQCVRRTALMSAKFLRHLLRLRNAALSRMGVQLLTPSRKNALLKRAARRIDAAWQRVLVDLQHACPDFEAIYGRSLASLEAALEASGSCVLGLTYVQNAFVCQ